VAKDNDEPALAKGRGGVNNAGKFRHAEAFLEGMPKAAIIDWLLHSEIGETLLAQLEKKLNRPDRE